MVSSGHAKSYRQNLEPYAHEEVSAKLLGFRLFTDRPAE